MLNRAMPLHLDLGCGDGSFLTMIARQNPHKDFLGVERLTKRVRSAARKTAGLTNVRIIRADTLFVLERLLGPESVEACYLLFPDPWPKRRHHRRRLISSGFLASVWSVLIPAGTLQIATDHTEYFAQIWGLVNRSNHFQIIERDMELDSVDSTFGKRFRAAGVPIHRLELRKISPVT